MRLRAAFALAPAALLLASCSSSDTTDQPEPTTTYPTATEVNVDGDLNTRGALEVALGETATVVQNGVTVLEISDTSLSTDGCKENTTLPGEVTKQGFSATVEVGPTSIPEWLWPTEFYYVDSSGKITKNIDVSDAEPCSGPGANAFKSLPANSAADGRVTLDIPNATEVIGYHTTQGGQDVRVEWVLPETATPVAADMPAAEQEQAVEQAPAVEVTPTVAQTPAAAEVETQPATAPPVGYTAGPVGDPQPLVGKVIDYCLGGDLYQVGTTQFTDGTTGWTQECANQ